MNLKALQLPYTNLNTMYALYNLSSPYLNLNTL